MAIRFSPWFIGTQFHPEADPEGLSLYLEGQEKKRQVTNALGGKRYDKMLRGLQDPGALSQTRRLLLPGFLEDALDLASPGTCSPHG